MKVRVVITVEMDDENVSWWAKNFGCEPNKRSVAADVRSYVGNGVQQAGVFGNGEIEANINWQ